MSDPLVLAAAAASAADDKLATDVVVLDVSAIISITSTFVIASGSNPPQVRAIAEEVERVVGEELDRKPAAIEGLDDYSWVLMDYGDVLVHVFLTDTRAYYDLDRLWSDAAVVDWQPTMRS